LASRSGDEVRCRASVSAVGAPEASLTWLRFQRARSLQQGDLGAAGNDFRKVLPIGPAVWRAAYVNPWRIEMRRKNWDRAWRSYGMRKKSRRRCGHPVTLGCRINAGTIRCDCAAIRCHAGQPEALQPRYLLACAIRLWGSTDAAKTLEPLWPQMSDQFVYLYVLGISHFIPVTKSWTKSVARWWKWEATRSVSLLMGKALLSHSDDEKALTESKKVEARTRSFHSYTSIRGWHTSTCRTTKSRGEFAKG